jgi:predicted transcriptional regulator
MNEDTKKKLMACVAYLEYRDVIFKEPLSQFNHLICECGEVLNIDRATIAQFVQHHFYDKLGMAFVDRQKELFKEAGLTYCFNQQKVKKEKARNKATKRDRVEPYSTFGKLFKERFGYGSKGNMPLYQACYSYYRQTGKYLWESDSWSTIRTKFGVE